MMPNILRTSAGDRRLQISAMGLMAMQPAQAQSVEQFYKGHTITILVGNSPGGINDITARLDGEAYRPLHSGQSRRRVQNNPGAGGVITANRLYHNAEKDGTVLAKFERAMPQLAIQGDPKAQFDPTKYLWLGSMSSYARRRLSDAINAGNPVKSVDDIKPGGGKRSFSAPTPPRRATSSSRSSPRRRWA